MERDLVWRTQVQRQVAALIARDPASEESLDAAAWRLLKDERIERIRSALERVIDPERNGWRAAAPAARHVAVRNGDGFRVENLVFAAFGSWEVGLNLFLPVGAGPFVPVLCPCGHGPKWQDDHQIPPQVLARHGFAAALFDMPMFGERRRQNDHFVQGAQLAMTGRWSNELFLVDAVRTADYLETRDDITFDYGMGVTGVSGGGLATTRSTRPAASLQSAMALRIRSAANGYSART